MAAYNEQTRTWDDSPDQDPFATSAFRSHVERTPYLSGKINDSDYGKAYDMYTNNVNSGQNRGDAVNHAISGLGWDDPNKWQTAAPPAAPTANPDSTWLNWIHNAYGDSKSRGGGFADLPQGQNIGDVISRFNAETGSNAKVIGGPSGDMVDFGQGAKDVLTSGGQLWYNYGPGGPPGQGASGNSNVAAWTGQAGSSGSNQAASSTSSSGSSSSTASSGPTPEQIAMQQQREAMRKQLFDSLMARSNQGLEVGRDNPQVRGQADAYAANEERSKRNYLSDIAEQNGPYATGNLRNEQRMANERVGQRTGAMEQSLMAKEVQAKRDEIAQALASSQGLLSDQDRLALTEKLAQMDDVFKRLSLDQNNSQFGQNLGLNYAQLAQQNDQFGRSLGTQNDQFLANFGLQSTDRANYWDALRSGLL